MTAVRLPSFPILLRFLFPFLRVDRLEREGIYTGVTPTWTFVLRRVVENDFLSWPYHLGGEGDRAYLLAPE